MCEALRELMKDEINEARINGINEGRISGVIKLGKEMGMSDEEITTKLIQLFSLSKENADSLLSHYVS